MPSISPSPSPEPPCKAKNHTAKVRCYPSGATPTSVTISLIDLSACPGASLTIIDQPQRGYVDDNGDGSVTYVPCANYSGSDNFSYGIEGVDEPSTAVVTISVTGDACNYYEAFKCNGHQRPTERIWVAKAAIAGNSAGFKYEDVCYIADDCPSCPESPGQIITPDEWMTPACSGHECFDCCDCVGCCWSTASFAIVDLSITTDGSAQLWDECGQGNRTVRLPFGSCNPDGYGANWGKLVHRGSVPAVYVIVTATLNCILGKWIVTIDFSGFTLWEFFGTPGSGDCRGVGNIPLYGQSETCGDFIPGATGYASVQIQNNHCCRSDDGCVKSDSDPPADGSCAMLP